MCLNGRKDEIALDTQVFFCNVVSGEEGKLTQASKFPPSPSKKSWLYSYFNGFAKIPCINKNVCSAFPSCMLLKLSTYRAALFCSCLAWISSRLLPHLTLGCFTINKESIDVGNFFFSNLFQASANFFIFPVCHYDLKQFKLVIQELDVKN